MSRRGTYDLKYGFIPDEDCPQIPKPHTNADRIRSMTDEELAEFLLDRDFGILSKLEKSLRISFKYSYESCLQNVKNWLKQDSETIVKE